MKHLTTAICIASLSVSNLFGGQLNKAQISSSAKWVAHADIDKLNTTTIWKLIKETNKDPKAANKIAAVTQVLGFNPLEDLSGVTLYGVDYKPNRGVVLLQGKIPAAHLEVLVRAIDSHKEVASGSHVIHQWIDEKKKTPVALCLYNQSMAVLGAELDDIAAAIAVLDSKDSSLAQNKTIVPDVSPDTLLFAFVQNDGNMVIENPQAAIFQNSKALTFAAAETDGKVSMELQLQAGSQEELVRIEQVSRGLLALMTLQSQNNPDAAKLAQDIRINVAGNTITFGLTRSAVEIMESIKVKIEMDAQNKQDQSAQQ